MIDLNIQLAKKAGFCYGVRRAVDMVYEQAEMSQIPVYTYGPITHNDIVVLTRFELICFRK